MNCLLAYRVITMGTTVKNINHVSSLPIDNNIRHKVESESYRSSLSLYVIVWKALQSIENQEKRITNAKTLTDYKLEVQREECNLRFYSLSQHFGIEEYSKDFNKLFYTWTVNALLSHEGLMVLLSLFLHKYSLTLWVSKGLLTEK